MRLSLGVICLWACASCSIAAEPAAWRFELNDVQVVIHAGDVPVATYVFRDETISRPYFAHVRTLGGAQVTRNHPPQQGDASDHATFHPGLWLAFGDIAGADNWRLKAKVEHVEFTEKPAGHEREGKFTVRNRYFAADGQRVICDEIARYKFHQRPGGWLLTWDSTFSSDAADFAFGDQEEMGLGVRMHTPLAVSSGKGARMLATDERTNERAIWGKTSPWCDSAGERDGRFVGVMLMTHPKNFRPAWWHVRDYGLMVANPFGQNALARGERSSVNVKRGEDFRLRFGVLLHDAASEKEFDRAAAYDDYVHSTAGDD